MKLFQVLLYYASTTTVTYTSFKVFPAPKFFRWLVPLIVAQLYPPMVMSHPFSPMKSLLLKQTVDRKFNQNPVILYYYPGINNRCHPENQDLSYKARLNQKYKPETEDVCPKPSSEFIQTLGQNIFPIKQQEALVEILQLLSISLHNHDLATIVRMTQCNELDQLTTEQQQQCQNWLIKEGNGGIRETHVLVKEKLVSLLRELKLYQTLIPAIPVTAGTLDHTLLLGGSIQQMQMRFLTMLAYFDNYGAPGERSLGELITLTCDRIVNHGLDNDSEIEIDLHRDTIWFDTDGDRALTGENKMTPIRALTEDTAYRAIHYAVEAMCNSDEYFKKHRYSVMGFHQRDHYPAISAINYLYKKRKYYYELTDEFRDAACRFMKKYPLSTYSSPEQFYGTTSVGRPTTKETVKNWIEEYAPCVTDKSCNILTISNQPNARYQQIAVMQGVEDKLNQITADRIRVMLTAMGSSTSIPTDEVLDNLSRALYMIFKRPAR